MHALIESLTLQDEVNWDYFILLVAKTGMRFSEALALTPEDFDFSHQTLSINKTWDYKSGGGFALTKNKSSVRKIQIDWQCGPKIGTCQYDHDAENVFAYYSRIGKPGHRFGHEIIIES